MQGIGCQWNCPLPHVPPPCSQSQQAVPLPPSPVRVRILEKPEIPLDTAKCLSKAHKHSMQGIGCQWNCPLPHVPPPCSQSQQAVPLPPSPVRVRILEKPEIPLDTAKCLSKAHKHSMQGIGCQWNCPLPHVPPPCSQSQQAVPLPPSPVRVRILEKPEIPLDTAKCLSKAHKHSMQGIGCQWNCPLPHVPPPCSQSQQAVPLPPSPVRVRILEKPEIL